MTSKPFESSAPPRRRPKVVDEIIETLRLDIVTRRLPHGERLPSEKDLSVRFNVSPPTVREAIRALETMGLVEIFHGSGSFVHSQGDFAVASALQTVLQLESVGIMEVFDVRRALARRSIELAAAHATEENLAAVEAASARYDDIDTIMEIDAVMALALNFQRAVSAASRSPLLQTLEAFLLALLNEVHVKSLNDRDIAFWRTRARKFQPHRDAIIAALRSSDPATARVAMDNYLDAQRAMFDVESGLSSLNLSDPHLISVVSNMVLSSRNKPPR